MGRRIDLDDPDAVAKLVRRAHRLRARYMSRMFRHVRQRIGRAFSAALEFRREFLLANKRPVHW